MTGFDAAFAAEDPDPTLLRALDGITTQNTSLADYVWLPVRFDGEMDPALRINDVERLILRVPFTQRTRRWNALLVWQWQIVEIIRVTTDDGSVGYGEEGLGAGLDMALYDVLGRALGVPLHRLLNRPKVRDSCPIAWWNTKMSPEDLAGEAQ